jgi:hypothetical protein
MDNPPAIYDEVDARGLTEQQRLFLLELAAGKTRKEAAKVIDTSMRTIQKWQNQPAFKQALASIFEGAIVETRNRLGGATATSADVLLEAMEAMKDATISVHCPNCDEDLEVTAKVPHWPARIRAAELVLRAAKVLKDVKEIEGTMTTMTIEQRIALALFKTGRYDQIPTFMWESLQSIGVIPADQDQPVNAQFVVVPENDGNA